MNKIKCYCCGKTKDKKEIEEIETKGAIYLVCNNCKLTHIKCMNILKGWI